LARSLNRSHLRADAVNRAWPDPTAIAKLLHDVAVADKLAERAFTDAHASNGCLDVLEQFVNHGRTIRCDLSHRQPPTVAIYRPFRNYSLPCEISQMSKIDMDTVRDRLRQAMTDNGIGAKPLSKAAGLGEGAVRDIREGKSSNPGIKTLAALAAQLGVSLEYLLGTDTVPANVVDIWSAIPAADRDAATRVLEAFKKRA
jgi:transcriptional regulator with XRE-family HTH domain